MQKIKILFVGLFLLVAEKALLAQSFEGIIDFKKYSTTDTTNYKYLVKDINVRIEELGKKGNVGGIMLVLPKVKSVRALNPERKVYMDIVNNKTVAIKGTPEIEKTKESKTIAGNKCTLWKIKSPEEETVISYWVAKGGWDFFNPLLQTLNRKDKLSYYWLSIPENAGYFPLEAEERSTKNAFKNLIKVEKLTKQAIDNKQFSIPAGYTELKK